MTKQDGRPKSSWKQEAPTEQKTGLPIPAGPDALTADWLTGALRHSGAIAQAKVDWFEAKSLGDDKGFIGQIAAIHLTYDRPEEGGPQRLIGKFSSAQPARRQHGLDQHIYEREVRFYQQIAAKVTLRTPRCYYSQMDLQTGLHVILLQDLAPARAADRIAGLTLAQAEVALYELACFHAAWWQNPELDQMRWMPDLNQMHDFQHIQERLPAMWARFEQLLPQPAPGPIRRLCQEHGPSLLRLGRALYLESPRTLVHFDYQPANLFFDEVLSAGQLTVIDWQLMTRGRGVTDVAYLLGENIAVDLRRSHELGLLQLYHQTLLEGGVDDYSFSDCLADYHKALLFRMLLIVFTVTHIPFTNEQRNLHLEVLWPRSNAAVLDLVAANVLEEFV